MKKKNKKSGSSITQITKDSSSVSRDTTDPKQKQQQKDDVFYYSSDEDDENVPNHGKMMRRSIAITKNTEDIDEYNVENFNISNNFDDEVRRIRFRMEQQQQGSIMYDTSPAATGTSEVPLRVRFDSQETTEIQNRSADVACSDTVHSVFKVKEQQQQQQHQHQHQHAPYHQRYNQKQHQVQRQHRQWWDQMQQQHNCNEDLDNGIDDACDDAMLLAAVKRRVSDASVPPPSLSQQRQQSARATSCGNNGSNKSISVNGLDHSTLNSTLNSTMGSMTESGTIVTNKTNTNSSSRQLQNQNQPPIDNSYNMDSINTATTTTTTTVNMDTSPVFYYYKNDDATPFHYKNAISDDDTAVSSLTKEMVDDDDDEGVGQEEEDNRRCSNITKISNNINSNNNSFINKRRANHLKLLNETPIKRNGKAVSSSAPLHEVSFCSSHKKKQTPKLLQRIIAPPDNKNQYQQQSSNMSPLKINHCRRDNTNMEQLVANLAVDNSNDYQYQMIPIKQSTSFSSVVTPRSLSPSIISRTASCPTTMMDANTVLSSSTQSHVRTHRQMRSGSATIDGIRPRDYGDVQLRHRIEEEGEIPPRRQSEQEQHPHANLVGDRKQHWTNRPVGNSPGYYHYFCGVKPGEIRVGDLVGQSVLVTHSPISSSATGGASLTESVSVAGVGKADYSEHMNKSSIRRALWSTSTAQEKLLHYNEVASDGSACCQIRQTGKKGAKAMVKQEIKYAVSKVTTPIRAKLPPVFQSKKADLRRSKGSLV